MSSPNIDPQRQNWQGHRHLQTTLQQPGNLYSQANSQGVQYEHGGPERTSYIQPHYAHTSPTPIIAELPAPLPPAPPTTTPEEQLKQDELLAHKMQNLEVEEERRRSSGAISQHQIPMNAMPPSPQPTTPLMHQRSAQSLRPHSQSMGAFSHQRPMTMSPLSTPQLTPPTLDHQHSARSLRPHSMSVGALTDPCSSISSGPAAPNPARFSSLPEVIVESHTTLYYDPKSPSGDLPIPVLPDRWPATRPSIVLEPSSLPTYLEQHLHTPYPPQWNLPPVLSTFYAYQESKPTSGSSWLDTPETCAWRSLRLLEHAHNPVPPSFAFKCKTVSGSFRSPRLSWTMTSPETPVDGGKKLTKGNQPTWAYDLKLDPTTGLRKSEVLVHGGSKSRAVLTTYVHALNYDTLRFVAPDGHAYMWVSNTKVSSVYGSRYDTLRHALFVAAGNIADPLYGHIVADHCFWDGHVNPDGDGVPDEALYVRSSYVDPALVVATLQVLKDWEKHTLRAEKRAHPKAFLATEEEARRCYLGKMSYWKA